MSNLTIFNFENTPVQTIVENNEIFFRATQLAELLQYKNPHDALRKHVYSDDLAKREIVNTINKRANDDEFIKAVALGTDYEEMRIKILPAMAEDRLEQLEEDYRKGYILND